VFQYGDTICRVYKLNPVQEPKHGLKNYKEEGNLSDRFSSEWSRSGGRTAKSSIVDKMHPVPLKERVTQTIYRLNMVTRKLEDSRLRIEQKHKGLFQKCVQAQERKEQATAIMYANECSQVRKMAQIILSSHHAIEQVILRLETVSDFGDVASEVMPAAKIIGTVRGRLAGVIPEVSLQLNNIGQTLDTLVLESGEATGGSFASIASGEDAERILSEASAIADQKIREGFPLLPSTEGAEKGVNPL
jgi:division protein CdvB (Snf7/Vps24/ESCRT-III family)